MFGPKAMRGFFGRGPWRGFDPRRGRVFGKGDLKYVILDLIRDRPAHGYEVMRELEGRFRGLYAPSPGSVYPTLQMLEDLGYVEATQQDGKKVYEITDEGRRYLEENRSIVDDIFSRVDDMGAFMFGPAMAVLGRAFGNLGRAGFRAAMRHQGDEQWVQRAREILERAARDIEGLN
jgi:DNA-binding PadR family transcriptional regulator